MEGLSKLKDAWNSLWSRCPKSTVFMHYQWSAAFASAFDLDANLFVIAVYDGDDLVAVLPLRRTQIGDLEMLGDPRSDYADLVCEDQNVQAAMECITGFLRERDDWRRLVLRELVPDGHLCRDMQSAESRYLKCYWLDASRCPGIDAKDAADCFSRLARKKSLVRNDNGLQKVGDVRLDVLRSWPDIEPHLDDLFRQHIERWNNIGQPSIYEKDEERLFCRLYTQGLAEAGLSHFSVLYCGDDVFAYHLGFDSNGTFTWYKPTFDWRYAKKSPGEVLIRRLLLHCDSADIEYFDFTRGMEHFKQRFANNVVHNKTLIVFSSAWDALTYRAMAGIQKLPGVVSHAGKQLRKRIRNVLVTLGLR